MLCCLNRLKHIIGMKPHTRRERGAGGGSGRGLRVVAIHISVKFACRLYLEFQQAAATVQSDQIRIDPKQTVYALHQEILFDGDEQLLVFVKLLSSKGLAFTAGTMAVDRRLAQEGNFRLPISKSQDIEAYCECQLLPSLPSTPLLSPKTDCPLESSAVTVREEPRLTEQLRARVKELQLELDSLRTSHQQLKLKFSQLGCSPSTSLNSPDRRSKLWQ